MASREVSSSQVGGTVKTGPELAQATGNPEMGSGNEARVGRKVDDFRVGEVVGRAWQVVKRNFGFLLGVYLLVMVGFGGVPALGNLVFGPDSLVMMLVSVVMWVLQVVVEAGMKRLHLSLVDGVRPPLEILISTFNLFGKILMGGFIYGLIVMVGLLLFVVPGVIWSIKYQFYIYLILEKEMTVMEAIRRSGEITQGKKWKLFVLGLANMGIVLLGALALGVGLIVAVPVVTLTQVVAYRMLEKAA